MFFPERQAITLTDKGTVYTDAMWDQWTAMG